MISGVTYYWIVIGCLVATLIGGGLIAFAVG